MINLDKIIRENIKKLKPYSSARDEFQGEASVFLDANENPYNAPYNRYPDPLQRKLKEKIARIKGVSVENIFLGNGSDEPIDLVFRAFCEPAVDNVVAIDPTYGMYIVAAEINNVEYRKVLLDENFDFSAQKLLDATNEHTKLIFLCSPNNPTGNSLNGHEIEQLIRKFNGLVVLDEAYIDFSSRESFIPRLKEFENLVVLQTFSKAWGLASIRLGMAFASKEIISILNKIKYPYNINFLTQEFAMESVDKVLEKEHRVSEILENRASLIKEMEKLDKIEKIYPSDSNFILVKVANPKSMYDFLVEKGIIVRNRSSIALCAGCLRITVGTKDENVKLIETMKSWK